MQRVLLLWLIIFGFINYTLAGSHFLSEKKELVTWIEKILHLLFIHFYRCFFSADCTFYDTVCQAGIRNTVIDAIS